MVKTEKDRKGKYGRWIGVIWALDGDDGQGQCLNDTLRGEGWGMAEEEKVEEKPCCSEDEKADENEPFPGMPEAVQKASAWTNKTPVQGKFEISFPWVGGSVCVKWPASGRQAMIEIGVACLAFMLIIVPVAYILFVGATPENLSSFGRIVSSSGDAGKPSDYRPPERIQVKTNDGIEIIEACPPCEGTDCSEDCPCPPCPVCPVIAPAVPIPPRLDAGPDAKAKTAPLL